jgi:hypothetical protein
LTVWRLHERQAVLQREPLDGRDQPLAVAPPAPVRLGDDQAQGKILVQLLDDRQADGRRPEENQVTTGHFFSFAGSLS